MKVKHYSAHFLYEISDLRPPSFKYFWNIVHYEDFIFTKLKISAVEYFFYLQHK